MALIVADCPRCRTSKVTFDVLAANSRGTSGADWCEVFEIFSVCRHCDTSTIFVIRLTNYDGRELSDAKKLIEYRRALNEYFEINGFINLSNNSSIKPPEHLPKPIEQAFREGTSCLAIKAYNAAATMFRLSLDLATRPLLPSAEDSTSPQPNSKQRRDLGLRLQWLFDQKIIPEDLRGLASCIREDSNDGAHVGNLEEEDTYDILDFTTAFLERLITEPARIKLAEKRRVERRSKK